LYAPDLEVRIDAAWALGPPLEAILPGRSPRAAFEQLQYVEMKTRLPDFIELMLDRIAMGHAVEVRVPFLDHQVVEYAGCIPKRLKLRRRTPKWILRAAAGDLVPDVLRLRPKRPLLAPCARWLRQRLPEFAAELLAPEAVRRKGYFNPAEVSPRLERHRAGVQNSSPALLGVLAVHILDDLFIAGRSPAAPPS
jgi:asparagine synthase (glutamine-hydrolysing)